VLDGKHFYEFDDFRVDPDERTITRAGDPVSLSGKAFDVLVMLLKHPRRLVRRDQLISEVWPNTFVEPGNLSVHITAIRKTLQRDYIEAVPKQGYRFVADVTEKEEPLDSIVHRPRRRARLFWGLALSATCGIAAFSMWMVGKKAQTRNVPPAVTASAGVRSKYELAVKYEYEGDDEQALAALDEATETDKNFVDGYLRAAFISNQLGEDDQALKYLDEAKNANATRSDHQWLQIEALDAELTDGYSEAVKKYRLLVDTYPNDPDDLYNFADLAMQSRKESYEATEALTRCLRIAPANPPCLFDRMMLYVLNNEFDRAISLHDSLGTPYYPWLDEPFGLALYGKGDLNKAREVLKTLSRQAHTHGTAMFTAGREWLADIDFFQGKIAEGSSEIQVLQPNDTKFGAASHYLYLSRVNGLLSNLSEARSMALKAVSEDDDGEIRLQAAAILACAGATPETDRLLKSAQKTIDLLPETDLFINGCKALNHGDYENAARQLQAADDIIDDLDTELFLAKAYIAARQWASAKAVLEGLEASKGRAIAEENSCPIIWPLAHYYLAVVFDASGERAQAIKYYSHFLNLWQAGDSNLALVANSKKRIAELQSPTKRK
jgi:DNA-binding winged helix-turn-helix (wHTH) protein/tetratricopeptide (TPR) repeat protein